MQAAGGYYFHPQRLGPIPGGSVKFPKKWFEKVVKRIEHTKPVQEGGGNSPVVPLISCTQLAGGDGTEVKFNGDVVILTVCVDGSPATLRVLTEKAK